MAASRFTPSMSVANQIRKTGLGVNTGGSTGRLATVHKGVGLNPASGGLNTNGSGAAPVPGRASGAAPTALGNRTFTPGPALDPYRRVVRNGQSVLVRTSRLTAADKAYLARAGSGAATSPAAAAPIGATPTAPAAPTAAAPGPLDYRNQSSYIDSIANLNQDVGDGEADIATQLADNAREYARQSAANKDSYGRDVESGEDNLNRGGLLRSGAREVADTQRFKTYDDLGSHLEEQYGSIATGKLNAALQRLHEHEATTRQGIENQASQSYSDLNPAVPEAATPAATPTPAAPAAQTFNTQKYLRMRVSDGKGGWKVQSYLRANMTPAQLKTALASDLNR